MRAGWSKVGVHQRDGDDCDKSALSFAGWEPPLVRGQIASSSCSLRASKIKEGQAPECKRIVSKIARTGLNSSGSGKQID